MRETFFEVLRSGSIVDYPCNFRVYLRNETLTRESKNLASGLSSSTMHLSGLGKALHLSDVHDVPYFYITGNIGTGHFFSPPFCSISGVFLYESVIL